MQKLIRGHERFTLIWDGRNLLMRIQRPPDLLYWFRKAKIRQFIFSDMVLWDGDAFRVNLLNSDLLSVEIKHKGLLN